VKEATDLQFTHRFEAGTDPLAPTLLLLHGTGGDENDLLPLGRTIAPGSALLSPRGKILENGMPRFFRRLAEGVFDQEDLTQRTAELAGFLQAAAERYGFELDSLMAVGFSNGANIAASLLLRFPQTLAGGILIRAMVPFVRERVPDLTGKRVLLLSGQLDPIVPMEQPKELASTFKSAGADVTLHWERAGHTLTQADVSTATAWLAAERFNPRRKLNYT
jgi:phospholipase/carboxylesterase